MWAGAGRYLQKPDVPKLKAVELNDMHTELRSPGSAENTSNL